MPPRGAYPKHRISNVDMDAKTGDCEKCGTGVAIYVNRNGRKSCQRMEIDSKDKALAKRRGFKPLTATNEELAAKLVAQGGVCAICERPDPDLELVRDHDHDTGKFRGWLCRACNRGMGLFGDDPARIIKVLRYLTGCDIILVQPTAEGEIP